MERMQVRKGVGKRVEKEGERSLRRGKVTGERGEPRDERVGRGLERRVEWERWREESGVASSGRVKVEGVREMEKERKEWKGKERWWEEQENWKGE